MATTCLMCGADLEEGDEEAEPPEDAEKPRRRLRGWVRGLAAVGLALVMLAASVFALLSAMNAGERAETSESTPASTLTPAASPTARRTPTLRVSPTPVVTSTPVPPRSHQVQQGETLSEIAAEFEVAVAEILAMNPDVDPELLQVGQVLLIPPVAGASGSGALGLSDDPDATRADFVVHVVRPGEALLSIAEEYGVSVQSIRQANDLGPYEDTIKVNQSLVIPLSAPSPTPTPTANPNSTPTARPPYVAPPLLSPIDGEVLEGMKQPVVLQWASVGILRDDEWYAATLLQPAGGTVSATHYTRVTSWRLADDLLISANTDGREFIWWVRVVKERHADGGQVVYVEAGAPSEPRRFIWLGPTPTPSPTPASSP
jgi:LysM repeat protein